MVSAKLPQRNVSALDRGHNALVEVLTGVFTRISKLEEQVAKLTATIDRTPNDPATQ